MPTESNAPTTSTPAEAQRPQAEPGFPANRWYRVEFQCVTPTYNEDGEFSGESLAFNADGSPITRKVVVFGLHKVARIANRISVNRMIRRLEEVPNDLIARAAQAHEAERMARTPAPTADGGPTNDSGDAGSESAATRHEEA